MAFSQTLMQPRVASGTKIALGQGSLQGQRVASLPVSHSRARSVPSGRVFAGIGDVGTYLADAAKQVFSPSKTNSPPNWSGTGTGFSGKVSHHEVQRLRDLYSLLRQARVGIQGCMDPNAANFDPEATSDDGTCRFIAADGQEVVGKAPDLRNYVTGMLSKVWGNAVANERSESTFKGSGYPFTGDIVSRRDIERLVRYEKIVKQELEKAEANEESKTPV